MGDVGLIGAAGRVWPRLLCCAGACKGWAAWPAGAPNSKCRCTEPFPTSARQGWTRRRRLGRPRLLAACRRRSRLQARRGDGRAAPAPHALGLQTAHTSLDCVDPVLCPGAANAVIDQCSGGHIAATSHGEGKPTVQRDRRKTCRPCVTIRQSPQTSCPPHGAVLPAADMMLLPAAPAAAGAALLLGAAPTGSR